MPVKAVAMGAAPEGPEEAPPVPAAKPARKARGKAKTSAKAPPAAPTPELAAPSSEIPEKAPETEEPSQAQPFGLAETCENDVSHLAVLGLAETSKNVAEEPAQTEVQAEEPVEPTPKAKPKPRAPPKKREAIPAGMNLADKAFCPICRAGPMTNATLLYRHTCPKSALNAKPRAPRYDDIDGEALTEDEMPQKIRPPVPTYPWDEEPPQPPPLRRQTHDYPQLSYRETLLQQQEQQRQARMARMIAPMRSHYRIVR